MIVLQVFIVKLSKTVFDRPRGGCVLHNRTILWCVLNLKLPSQGLWCVLNLKLPSQGLSKTEGHSLAFKFYRVTLRLRNWFLKNRTSCFLVNNSLTVPFAPPGAAFDDFYSSVKRQTDC